MMPPENTLRTSNVEIAVALWEIALARGYEPTRRSDGCATTGRVHVVTCVCDPVLWQQMIAGARKIAAKSARLPGYGEACDARR